VALGRVDILLVVVLAVLCAVVLGLVSRRRSLPGAVVALCCALPLAAAVVALAAPGAVAANAPDGFRYLDQLTLLRTGGFEALRAGHIASGKELYPILLLPLALAVRPTLAVLAVVNAAFAAAAVLLTQPQGRAGQVLANRWIRYYPFASASFLFFMLLPLREGAIVLFLLLFTREVGERGRIAPRLFCLGALVFLRPVVALCAALALALMEARSRRLVHRPAIVAGGVALAAGLLALPPIRSQILGVTPAMVAADRNYNASFSNSGLPPADGTSWATLAAGLPRDLANVWLRPNPMVDRSAFVVATVDTVGLLALTRAAVRTRRLALRAGGHPEARIPLARATYALWFTFSMAVMYALTVGDLGQLLRGRLAVLAVLWQSQLYEKEPYGDAHLPSQPQRGLRPGLHLRPRGRRLAGDCPVIDLTGPEPVVDLTGNGSHAGTGPDRRLPVDALGRGPR